MATTLENQDSLSKITALPKGADKEVLIGTINGAVSNILATLEETSPAEPLPRETLGEVQEALKFLKQCISFKDPEFRQFARERAQELETAFYDYMVKSKAHAEEAARQKTAPAPTKKAEEPAPAAAEKPGGKVYEYLDQEKACVKYAVRCAKNRFGYLRGQKDDEDGCSVIDDGVPPFFVFAREFEPELASSVEEMMLISRATLERRVYRNLPLNMSDSEEQAYLKEKHHGDIIGLLSLGFDRWSNEMDIYEANKVSAQKAKAKKAKKKKKGFGSFFGKSASKPPSPAKAKIDTGGKMPGVRTFDRWREREKERAFALFEDFNFDLISYIFSLDEKKFEAEYRRISQIVDQQTEENDGPVMDAMGNLYRYFDQIFFDLVLLALFYRKGNKFKFKMLQAGLMSQEFKPERLIYSLDEMKRRPQDQAQAILDILYGRRDAAFLADALTRYFDVMENIYVSQFEASIAEAEDIIMSSPDDLSDEGKRQLKGIQNLIFDIKAMHKKEKEDNVYLTDEIALLISSTIETITR